MTGTRVGYSMCVDLDGDFVYQSSPPFFVVVAYYCLHQACWPRNFQGLSCP